VPSRRAANGSHAGAPLLMERAVVERSRNDRTGALTREGTGVQAKIAGYDRPERRFIQSRSPGRPYLSALPTDLWIYKSQNFPVLLHSITHYITK